ncbi:hypothetical protein VI03_07035 [Burkholderia vietnamiensis]|nr:hypothetical protein VI03_07035 [Burkholderia vietnamiensis]
MRQILQDGQCLSRETTRVMKLREFGFGQFAVLGQKLTALGKLKSDSILMLVILAKKWVSLRVLLFIADHLVPTGVIDSVRKISEDPGHFFDSNVKL